MERYYNLFASVLIMKDLPRLKSSKSLFIMVYSISRQCFDGGVDDALVKHNSKSQVYRLWKYVKIMWVIIGKLED